MENDCIHGLTSLLQKRTSIGHNSYVKTPSGNCGNEATFSSGLFVAVEDTLAGQLLLFAWLTKFSNDYNRLVRFVLWG